MQVYCWYDSVCWWCAICPFSVSTAYKKLFGIRNLLLGQLLQLCFPAMGSSVMMIWPNPRRRCWVLMKPQCGAGWCLCPKKIYSYRWTWLVTINKSRSSLVFMVVIENLLVPLRSLLMTFVNLMFGWRNWLWVNQNAHLLQRSLPSHLFPPNQQQLQWNLRWKRGPRNQKTLNSPNLVKLTKSSTKIGGVSTRLRLNNLQVLWRAQHLPLEACHTIIDVNVYGNCFWFYMYWSMFTTTDWPGSSEVPQPSPPLDP